MELFLNKFLSNIPVRKTAYHQTAGYSYATTLQSPDKDTFVKGAEPCFTGKRGSGSTKKGDVLKELNNITCPYSGVKMIPSKTMDRIENKLSKCNTIQERMEILEMYKSSMQKLEKQMFSIFKGYEINYPDGSLNECLLQLYPDALAELKIEQLKVLDSVDKISNKMDAKTALEVRKITTEARGKIIHDDPYVHERNPKARTEDHIFKRKDLLLNLKEATSEKIPEALFNEMWDAASKLPKSSTNLNAFIVKYADRSPNEIAARLLRPSVASIEHIRPANPDSEEIEAGENELWNFMLTSRDWNSGRGNTPLPEFVKSHPSVPKYSQRYIDDIIKSIHKDILQDCDWYPFVIKEKLFNESQGLIDVNLNKYRKTEEEAFANAKPEVINVYNDLLEKNADIRKA